VRVNFEESELSGARLRKLTYLLKQYNIQPDPRMMAIGYLVDLWHQAVNSDKRELTRSEIVDFLGAYDDKTGDSLITALEGAGYIEKTEKEDFYSVVGKEKDYQARTYYANKGKAGGKKKAENAAKCQQKPSTGLAQAKHRSSTGLAQARKSLAQVYPIQIRSDQIRSDQYNTDNDHDPSVSVTIEQKSQGQKTTPDFVPIISEGKPEIVAIAPAGEENRSATFRRKWFEMYGSVMNGANPPWGRRENAVVKELLSTYSLSELIDMVDVYFRFKPLNCSIHGYPLVGHSSSFRWAAQQLYADIKNPLRRLSDRNLDKELKEELKIRERVNMVNNKEMT
jgi:hypothetical protein